MTKQETIERVRTVCRTRRLSRHTENTYAGWIARFCEHTKTCTALPREERIRLFLEKMAPVSAASTQNQALNAIYLPDGLERKFPNGGKDWPWFWIWPAGNESTDPRTGIFRRHHIHEHTMGKALRAASIKAGLHKRVTAHTLRHSFATNLLTNGASITQVQELLGHTSVETTQVYLHCIPQFASTITSPMDAPFANIVSFAAHAEPVRRLA